MRNKKKRTEYTEEFKQQAISLVRDGNRVAFQVADELEINKNTLYNWLSAAGVKSIKNVGSKSSDSSLENECKRLRKELKQSELERDILKKAAAYFAKESL